MEAYAIILSVDGRKTALSQFNPTCIGGAVVKDIGAFLHCITEGVAGLFNAKTIKDPKYICVRGSNLNEKFETFLHDVPARLFDMDGRPHDIYKNGEVYEQINENIDPVRQTVKALTITTTKDRYVFFGGGIHLTDVDSEFQRLHQFVLASKEKQKQMAARPVIELPHIDLGSLGKLIPQIRIGSSEKEDNE